MNPYQTLGVDPQADDATIKAAYRALSRKFHPDRKGGSAEKMSALNVAYGILRDPQARERYDLTGDAAPAPPVDQQARTIIVQMLKHLFFQAQMGEVDIHNTVAKSLQKNIADERRNLAGIPEAIKRMHRMRARMKIKTKTNIVDDLVEHMERELELQKTTHANNIAQLTRAIELWRETSEATEPLDAFGRKMDPIANFLRINSTLD